MLRSAVLAAVLADLPGIARAQSLRDARSIAPPRAPSPTPLVQNAPPAAPVGTTIPVGESLQSLITKLVVEEIPHEYENTKKWGGTKRVMSGLDWELDGIKVETRRQWKEANHGTWSRYKLRLVEPERTFEVRIENLRDMGDNVAAFDLIGIAQLDCSGRLSKWQRGVQLVSLSGEANAKVRLLAHVEVKMAIDPRTFPPDILLSPKVTSADLALQEFELRRLSKAEGPLVKQVGEVLEEGVQDYLAEHRQKLTDKMNAQIEKKRSKLRVPLSQLTTSAWGQWFEDFLGKK